MAKRLLMVLLCLCVQIAVYAATKQDKKIEYHLTNDWIDVVIVSHPKDKETLDLCIDGIRQNCGSIRRVIVVSSEPLTDNAEWFNEADYPFSKEEVGLKIGRGEQIIARTFFGRNRSLGWYYQQLLKLYAPFVIPGYLIQRFSDRRRYNIFESCGIFKCKKWRSFLREPLETDENLFRACQAPGPSF